MSIRRTISLYPLHTSPRQQSPMLREMPSGHNLSSEGKWEHTEYLASLAMRDTVREAHFFSSPTQNTDMIGMVEGIQDDGRTVTRTLNLSKGHRSYCCADSIRKSANKHLRIPWLQISPVWPPATSKLYLPPTPPPRFDPRACSVDSGNEPLQEAWELMQKASPILLDWEKVQKHKRCKKW